MKVTITHSYFLMTCSALVAYLPPQYLCRSSIGLHHVSILLILFCLIRVVSILCALCQKDQNFYWGIDPTTTPRVENIPPSIIPPTTIDHVALKSSFDLGRFTFKSLNLWSLIKILPNFCSYLAICHLINCFHSLDEVSQMVIF